VCTERARQELMRALSVRIRNWCARSACESEIKWCLAPPKVKVTRLYFSPKSPTQKGFMVQKSWKSERWKISHLGTFNFETLKPPKLRLIQNRLLFYPTPLTPSPYQSVFQLLPTLHPWIRAAGGRLGTAANYSRRPLTDGWEKDLQADSKALSSKLFPFLFLLAPFFI
jgi:hypothetical protein